MKTVAVIVGLLLVFLLFTSQGRDIAELAMGAATDAARSHPAPDPAQVAREEAANQAWCAAHPGERAYHWPPCGR